MKDERRFLVRKTGGRLGWPRFWIEAGRVGHQGFDFAAISFECGELSDDRHFHMSVEQAERVLELLPDAIKFAKGQKASLKGLSEVKRD